MTDDNRNKTAAEIPSTLAELWQRFETKNLRTLNLDWQDPRHASLHELIQRAFYLGATGAFGVFDYLAENEPEAKTGMAMINRLYEEIKNFYDSVKKNTTSDDAAASE